MPTGVWPWPCGWWGQLEVLKGLGKVEGFVPSGFWAWPHAHVALLTKSVVA